MAPTPTCGCCASFACCASKLLKVLDGGRQFKRFERWLSLRHTVAETVGVVVTMAFCAHWTACLWMLIVALERDVAGGDHAHTWVSEEGFDTFEYRVDPGRPWPLDPFKMYSVCLYWSMQTLTTIGYGGTASPTNQAEYVVASFAMMAGSILWAYLIGKISTLMHFLSQTNMEHHQRLDRLESFIEEKHLSYALAHRLRRYFLKRRSLDKMETYQVLLNHMSPTLRGDVAEAMTGKWLHRVSWLRNAQRTFVTSLAMLMRPEIYPPMEMFTGETFHVVARGVVIKDMKILCSGMVWGLDMILTNKTLRRMRPAIALTYVEVLELRRGDLINLLSRFPKARKRVRKAVIWMAFQRKFLAHAREIEMLTTQVSSLLLKEVGSRAKVRACFSKYDSDGDGWINCREFSDSLRDLGFNARSEIVDALVARFDTDNDGKISLTEFFAFFDTYSKSSSRLLNLKSKKNLLSIGSSVESRVVDKEHGLNMDDDGGSGSGGGGGGGDDDGSGGGDGGSIHSRMAAQRASPMGSDGGGGDGGGEGVHAFSASRDLGLDRVGAEEVDKLKAQMKAHHDILDRHLKLIAQKLDVELIDHVG